MKCVKCGKTLKSNEKFCTNCGYYNDGSEEEIKEELEEKEENWFEDEVEANIKEDEEEIIIPQEKPKKEKRKKTKKEKEIKLETIVEEKPQEEIKLEPVEEAPQEEVIEDKVKEVPVVKEKPKKEKKKKEEKVEKKEEIIKEDTSNNFYYKNERYLEAYIGEDYKIIKKRSFNIWAFLLNWMYLLYRKLFITGIIGLIITSLVAVFLTKYFLIYLIIMLVVLGFGFNPYYIFISKNKVEKVLEEYDGSDSFTLEKICKELGGVNIVFSLIIYMIFLIVIVLSITGFKINVNHNTKFWKENSENQANCLSLSKLAYNQEKANYKNINEAICKVSNDKDKQYKIYLKAIKNKEEIYIYYETEKDYIVYKNSTEIIPQLQDRKNKENISEDDIKLLNELLGLSKDYSNSRKASIKEDELIKNRKDKEEKHNYIISYDELIR